MTVKLSKILGCALIVVGAVAGGCGSRRKAAASKPLTADQKQLNVKSFDQVWTTIKDKHFDPKLNGADWDGARAELRPKIEQANTMTEAREIMGELIGKLKQTHFGIIPA